ncbi:MAG: cation-translocating P-type ATPase, partial [Oscillospiraceae bacterium]|nr:cation-translocating P-type ATPase [Oscillospiraceae bacterium]
AYLFNVLVISNNFDWNIISHYITDFGHLTHQITRALTIGIAIMVVSVPEGLPMMITVVLSSNMKRMMRDNVLVKKLVGIETAGSLNLLFTDKTGTITRGVLTAHRLVLADGSEFADVSQLRKAPAIHRLFVMNARYNATSEPTFTEGGCVMAGGNATEKSIFQFAQQDVGMYNASVDGKTMFNSERKFSSVTLSGDSGREVTLVKGATEAILSRCTKYINATGEVRPFGPNIPGGGYAKLGATVNEIAHAAGRVIAIAYSEGVAEKDTLPQDMILVGIVAIRDQLRPEAQKSIRQLRSAGIQPVMITGDSIDTARAIATECGILTPNSNSLVITSTELAAMTDGEIRAAMPRLAVVARALPSDKSRLVRIAQEAELVVGMTGDGINDAPALKRADVGFAMGSGTEIAREAGDIVILDNNLASITKAVLYGRTIFKSIRKFITFQLTMNLCAVGVSFLGQLLGVGTPITVVQMLWVNIIMDTLGGLAFAGEPPLASYMKEPPKRRDESILTRGMVQQIWTMGVFAVTLCSLFLASRQAQNHFDFFYNEIYFYTAFYALFIFTGVIICFISRSERINLLANIGRNKLFLLIMAAIMVIQIAMLFFGGEVFRTAGMSGGELAFVFGLSLLVLPMDFLRRLWVKQRK